MLASSGGCRRANAIFASTILWAPARHNASGVTAASPLELVPTLASRRPSRRGALRGTRSGPLAQAPCAGAVRGAPAGEGGRCSASQSCCWGNRMPDARQPYPNWHTAQHAHLVVSTAMLLDCPVCLQTDNLHVAQSMWRRTRLLRIHTPSSHTWEFGWLAVVAIACCSHNAPHCVSVGRAPSPSYGNTLTVDVGLHNNGPRFSSD